MLGVSVSFKLLLLFHIQDSLNHIGLVFGYYLGSYFIHSSVVLWECRKKLFNFFICTTLDLHFSALYFFLCSFICYAVGVFFNSFPAKNWCIQTK